MKASIENEELKRKLDSVKTQTELQMQEQLTAEVSESTHRNTRWRATTLRAQAKEMGNNSKIEKTHRNPPAQNHAGDLYIYKAKYWGFGNWRIPQKESFPFDEISEVRKGARGADCIQRVHTRNMANTSLIYYELHQRFPGGMGR